MYYQNSPQDFNYELYLLIAHSEQSDSRLTANQRQAAYLNGEVWNFYIRLHENKA